MANQPVTREKLINADIDVDNLGKAVNELGIVNPRYGDPYYSGPMAVQHIMDMGGWDSFPTQAELQASAPTTSTKVAIALDTGFLWRFSGGVWANTNKRPFQEIYDYVNGNPKFKRKTITTENIKSITDDGDYSQSNKANAVPANGYPSEIEANDAGFLNVKSIFNESGTISVYRLLEWRPRTTGTIFFCSYIYATNSWTNWIRVSTNADLEELKSEILVDIGKVEAKIVKPYDIVTQSPNLFDESKVQDNAYINNSGVIISSTGAAGWGMSDFIPVTPGEYYTISGTRGRHGVGFYSTGEQALTSSLSYNGATTLPLTVQAPAGANFMLINVYAASTPTYSDLQVEKGSVATAYMPYGNLYEINPAYIKGMGSNSKNRLEINGNIAKVYGEINGKSVVETIQLTKANTHSQSTVLNMVETSIDGVIHRTMTDDVAPLRADNTTIGANHGYAKVTVTSASHGKTTADIGSVWSDGSYQWVIIDIVSANQIAVTARADNRSTLASNNITHVSGAVNTSGFTATASTAGQWYQAFKNRKLNVSVDGVPVNIAEDGVHQFSKNVSFHESYEIMKKNDIVEWLVSNKGQDYQQYNADSSILLSQSYSYDKEIGCTIYSSIVALRSIPFVDYMATQAIPFNSGNSDVLYTVPKSTNFGELVNITTNPPSATVDFTVGNLEAGATPVDRLIMLNNSAGFVVGYLPILSADPTERAPIGRYGEIRVSSNKWYPRVAYNSASVTMNAGDHYEVIAYRKPFLKSAERTASYAVRSTQGDYLYLNWHTAKRDVIQLPDDLVGREFEIVEKSSNVTLLSKFATNSIVCDVGSSLSSGYLTLKFK